MLSTHWLCCVMWDVSNTRWGIQFNVIFPSYRSCWASGEAHSAIKMLIISNICGSMIMKWNNRHSECYFYFLQFYNLILFPHFIFADESAPLVGVWYAILELFICFNDRGINFCSTFRFVCSNVFAHFARICLIKRLPLEFVCTFLLIFLRLLLLPSYFRSVECSHFLYAENSGFSWSLSSSRSTLNSIFGTRWTFFTLAFFSDEFPTLFVVWSDFKERCCVRSWSYHSTDSSCANAINLH